MVLNILVYGGNQKYNGTHNICDIFENPKLARELMFKKIFVKDLNALHIEDLSGNGQASVLEILLKIGRMRGKFNILVKYAPILKLLFKNIP